MVESTYNWYWLVDGLMGRKYNRRIFTINKILIEAVCLDSDRKPDFEVFFQIIANLKGKKADDWIRKRL